MSSPAEVSLLKQQVSTHRNGSGVTSPKAQRRTPGGAYKIAIIGPMQAGKTKIAAQVNAHTQSKAQ